MLVVEPPSSIGTSEGWRVAEIETQQYQVALQHDIHYNKLVPALYGLIVNVVLNLRVP